MSYIEVGAGLVFRQHTLLITQRPFQGHLGGLWEFPGGKREPEETFEACVQRELMEELGIQVQVGPLLESLTHEYPEKTVHLKFFRCQWQRHEPRALGCPNFRWVTQSQLSDHSFPEADSRLLSRLITGEIPWLG